MSLTEKFANYITDFEGGVYDVYSQEEKNRINSVLLRVPWQKATNDPLIQSIQKNIEDTANTSTGIPKMKEQFTAAIDTIFKQNKTPADLKNLDIFVNRMPYGTDSKDKNEYLDKITIDKSKVFSNQFISLFRYLYPDEFAYLNNNENNVKSSKINIVLESACGSMSEWPKIDPKSVGLGNIGTLGKLFEKYYLNYESGTPIDKKQFFNDFVNNTFLRMVYSKMNIGNDNGDKVTDFKEKLEGFYNFDTDLWFGSTPDFEIGSDSYGYFFGAPCFLQGNYGSNAFSGKQCHETYDADTGILSHTEGVLSDRTNKNHVLLFQSGKIGTSDFKLNNPSNINTFNFGASQVPSELQLLLNTTQKTDENVSYGAIFGSDVKQASVFASNASGTPTNIFDPINDAFKPDKEQNTGNSFVGGKKKSKKQKGGDKTDGFDTNTEPYLNARRIGKELDVDKFKKASKKFFEEFSDDSKIKNKLETIIDKLSKLPLFYHSRNDTRLINLSFNEIATVYLFNSVTTNSIKLIVHFFENIKACLNYLIKFPLDETSKKIESELVRINKEYNVAIEDKEYFDTLIDSVSGLVKHVDRTIEFLKTKTNLLEIGKNSTLQLFLGAKKSGAAAYEESDYKFFKSFVVISTLKNNGNKELEYAKFSKLLKNLSMKEQIALGGLPFASEYINTTFKIWTTFYFCLRWRELGNITLDTEFNKYMNHRSIEISDEELDKIRKEVKDEFPNDVLKIFASDSTTEQIVKAKLNLVQKIIVRYYSESNAIAKVIVLQQGILKTDLNKKRIKVRKSITDLLSARPASGSRMYYKPEVTIAKSLNMFKYRVHEIINLLWVVMKPNTKDMMSNQYLYIVSRLRNMVYRLKFLNASYYVSSNEEKKKLIEESGFSNIDIKSGKIENTMNQMVFNQVMKMQLQDPSYIFPDWWERLENKFYRMSSSRIPADSVAKLFVLAVSPTIDTGGNWSKVDVYLIDVFQAAQVDKKKAGLLGISAGSMVKRNFSFTKYDSGHWYTLDETGVRDITGTNNTRKYFYDTHNYVINLTSLFGDFSALMQKIKASLTPDEQKTAFWSKLNGLKKYVGKGLNPDDLSLYSNMDRLIGNKLYTIVPEMQNFIVKDVEKKIFPLFLQGSTDYDLRNIIYQNSETKRADNPKEQYQIYRITDKIIKDPMALRTWCYNLLFSMPNDFFRPSSAFEMQMQFPISKYFMTGTFIGSVKSGSPFGSKYSLLKYYLDKINPLGSGQTNIKEGQVVDKQRLYARIMKALQYGNFISRDSLLHLGLVFNE